jgi:plasmid stability protein
MPVNISIKNVPDDLAARLRAQAARHHRSLQGHLMALLEQSVAVEERVTPGDILRRVRELRLETEPEAVAMVRADRDGR